MNTTSTRVPLTAASLQLLVAAGDHPRARATVSATSGLQISRSINYVATPRNLHRYQLEGDVAAVPCDSPPGARSWTHETVPGADGNTLNIVTAGPAEAPTVVLLHGWPGFWFDWREVIRPVAETCRVIALDMRGFGASLLPPGQPVEQHSGETNLGRDVCAVLDHLAVDAAVLAGFDVGAAVAQWVARQQPTRVNALVLMNPTHPNIGPRRDQLTLKGEFWYQQLHQLPWAAELIGHDRETTAVYLRHFYQHWCATPDALTAEDFEAIIDTYAQPGAVEASIAWYRARRRDRAAQASADPASLVIRHPTTVLWSDSDPVFPPEWAEGLEDCFARLTFVPVAGAGHFLPWERPGVVVDAIRDAATAAAPADPAV
jgi:pimeloyl-ACP methyl ester carboxylesterase